MINKILVFWGLAIIAILFVENIVTWYAAYVFMDTWSTTWMLVIVSSVIWWIVWYSFAWMLKKDNWDTDNYDF